MNTDRLNLSKRPFVNNRPVTRTAILLWALGFLLLLVNVLSFWSYLESSREKRAELRAGQEKVAKARMDLARREEQVAHLDLGRQNDEVAYLNGKIAQRTFSWSRLMDRISEVMPNDVRLQRLAPRGLADEREDRPVRRVAARRQSLDRVTLTVDGQSRSDEAILDLVDNFFAHPSFADPNLTRESHETDGLIRFNLTVAYLPNAPVTGYVRPPAHHWKLSPAPGAPAAPTLGVPTPQLQAGTPGNPAFRPAFQPAFQPVPRPLPPSPPAPSLGASAPPAPAFRPQARPLVRPAPQGNDPLRGIGTPTRRRTGSPGNDVPSEARPNEQGR